MNAIMRATETPLIRFFLDLARMSMFIPVLGLIGMAVMWVVLSLDREPPYRVVSASTPEVRQGETAIVQMVVWRSKTKACDARVTRTLIAADGHPHLLPSFEIGAHEFSLLAQTGIEVSSFPVAVESHVAPGAAKVVTTRKFVCNFAHRTVPVVYRTIDTINVLPANGG